MKLCILFLHKNRIRRLPYPEIFQNGTLCTAMPSTNESRNLRQARPYGRCCWLATHNAFATPSMGFFNNIDYNTTKMRCQVFFSISFDSERAKLSTKTYDKTPCRLQDHLACVQRQVGKRWRCEQFKARWVRPKLKQRSCKQDKESAASPTGAYKPYAT